MRASNPNVSAVAAPATRVPNASAGERAKAPIACTVGTGPGLRLCEPTVPDSTKSDVPVRTPAGGSE